MTSKGIFETIRQTKPHALLLYLALFSIATVFFILILIFLTQKNINFSIPTPFYFSTAIIVVSSLGILKLSKWYRLENYIQLRLQIMFVLASSIAFLVTQYIGWGEIRQNMTLLEAQTGVPAFLIVLSVVHALHIVAGIIYWGYIFILVWKKTADPVNRLIYFTDPYETTRLKLASIYWHFLGVLWLLLLLLFLIKTSA